MYFKQQDNNKVIVTKYVTYASNSLKWINNNGLELIILGSYMISNIFNIVMLKRNYVRHDWQFIMDSPLPWWFSNVIVTHEAVDIQPRYTIYNGYNRGVARLWRGRYSARLPGSGVVGSCWIPTIEVWPGYEEVDIQPVYQVVESLEVVGYLQ